MVEARKFTVGRSRTCDVVLVDPTVSRRHAELVQTDTDRYYLADCGSKFGTHVRKGGSWRSIRQMFVGQDDVVRLGQFETSVGHLLSMLQPPGRRSPSLEITDADNLKHARQTQIVARSPSHRDASNSGRGSGRAQRSPPNSTDGRGKKA